MLLDSFVPAGPVLLDLDDTIERRRGKRIGAKGICRDPARSSNGPFVKASGLRWLSLMLLVPISWAGQVWALPFLTTLAPSERYCRERGLRHKKLTDRGRQLVLQARRWMPRRRLVLVADSGFSALEFLAALLRREIACVTGLRLDAALYRPAPPRRPGTIGRPRTKGERLPTLAEVLADKTTRWRRVKVPGWYGEGDRLGVETQRQWSGKAIARTTPCLLGLFSIVTLFVSRLDGRARAQASTSAWYHKQRPTFVDSLAAVRRAIRTEQGFAVSRHSADTAKLPPALREGIDYALCHAA